MRKQLFWDYYFRVSELSELGNEGTSERLETEKDVLKRQYILANIPEKYFHFDFETLKAHWIRTEDNVASVAKIEKYLESLENAAEKGIGLYVHGPHGVAKTTIATIILKKAIQLYYRCFFAKSTEIVEFARSGWKNEDRKVFFDYVVNTVDFFVIDDVARLKELTDAEKIHIDKIFTKRDDKNLVTILTSNQDIEDNREFFGDALFSNFKERLIPVKFIGSDYRGAIGISLLEKLDGRQTNNS